MGMLVRDGGGLLQDPGLVQTVESRQAGSRGAGGRTGPLSRPDACDGRVGVQDESGQGLGQVAVPCSVLHVWWR